MRTIQYNIGFCIRDNHILLIKKNRGPKGVCGFWNGIGGKLNKSERLSSSMDREFKEETGAYVEDWSLMGSLTGLSDPDTCYILWIFKSQNHEPPFPVQDEGLGEKLEWFKLDSLPSELSDNLAWLIPMILNRTTEDGKFYIEFD